MTTLRVSENIILYQRERSPFWWAKVRVNGELLRFSTEEKDIIPATKKAEAKLVSTKPTPSTCEKYIKEYLLNLRLSPPKPIYKSYMQITEKWILPFFGDKTSSEINNTLIGEYHRHVYKTLGRPPAKSTINSHHVVLRAIFDLVYDGEDNFRMPKMSIKNKGRPTEQRDAITFEEYRILVSKCNDWQKTANRNKVKENRWLLQQYIRIVAMTGIRPGTETRNILFDDVEQKNDQTFIRIRKGKRGGRTIACSWLTYQFISAIKLKFPTWKYVFEGFTRESQIFIALCEYCGISGRQLYGLRHMYASRKIMKGVPLAILADQMGTSQRMIEVHYKHIIAEKYAHYFS